MGTESEHIIIQVDRKLPSLGIGQADAIACLQEATLLDGFARFRDDRGAVGLAR